MLIAGKKSTLALKPFGNERVKNAEYNAEIG
jgi:hypothetical protein